MGSEERSAISVVFVLLVAATMTAVAVAPDPGDDSENPPVAQAENAAVGQAGNTSSVTTISVGVTGEARGQPDVAVLSLESSATATDPGTAADRLARNASELRAALQAADVSADQIQTTYYDVSQEQPEPDRAGDANETVYRARQGFAVRVENTSRVGEVVDVAVGNGATAVRNVEFTLSEANRSALRERALEDAVERARSEAETLAATEDLTVTGVERIATGDGGFEPVTRETAAVADASATQIESGPVTVEARVEVTYNATA